MRTPVPRVAAVHDLSGFGRASLTMIMPILSTMGIQVCPVPTAILSSHTGGFKGYKFIDLTADLEEYLAHWQELGIHFDGIYTGFLGSPQQVEIISRFIDSGASHHPLVVIDPVLGDNGKLYQTMEWEMVEQMKGFIGRADVITPNFTEACFLLDEEYQPCIDEKNIKDWLRRLADMGPETVIITSVPDCKTSKITNVVAYDRQDERFWKVKCEYIPAFFPGTGDGFTSVIVGSMLTGDSLPVALDRAVHFITLAIRASYGYNYPQREGVLLERVLDSLKAPVVVSSYEIME
jgi:pyridoxine kinase